MSDPLAVFYTWPLLVERKTGTNGKGKPVYAAAVTVMCRVRMVAQVVTTADGQEVTTVAAASCSASTPRIPPGSRVTMPDALSGRPGEVAVEGLHDLQIPRTPAFYQFQITGGA